MTVTWTPTARHDVTVVALDEDLVVLDGDGGLHVLNPSAAAIWNCCTGNNTIAEIVMGFTGTYGGACVVDDVTGLLHRLLELGLVT